MLPLTWFRSLEYGDSRTWTAPTGPTPTQGMPLLPCKTWQLNIPLLYAFVPQFSYHSPYIVRLFRPLKGVEGMTIPSDFEKQSLILMTELCPFVP